MTGKLPHPLFISFCSYSGHQGKITLILYLARLLEKRFSHRILVIDLELDGKLIELRKKQVETILAEGHARPDYGIVYINPAHLFNLIPFYSKQYDLIFMNIPAGQNLQTTADIFLLSDICIISLTSRESQDPGIFSFLKRFEHLKDLKETRALPFHYFGILDLLDSDLEEESLAGLKNLGLPFLRNSLNAEHADLQSPGKKKAGDMQSTRSKLALEFHDRVISPFLS